MGPLFEILFSIEALLRLLVESLKVGDVRLRIDEVGVVIVELSDKHAELGTPVTNVVYTVNFVAEELEDAAN